MKRSRVSAGKTSVTDEFVKRPAKLEPIRKSGREKHSFLGELYEEEDLSEYKRRESVFDYFDDGEADEDPEDEGEESEEEYYEPLEDIPEESIA